MLLTSGGAANSVISCDGATTKQDIAHGADQLPLVPHAQQNKQRCELVQISLPPPSASLISSAQLSSAPVSATRGEVLARHQGHNIQSGCLNPRIASSGLLWTCFGRLAHPHRRERVPCAVQERLIASVTLGFSLPARRSLSRGATPQQACWSFLAPYPDPFTQVKYLETTITNVASPPLSAVENVLILLGSRRMIWAQSGGGTPIRAMIDD